MILLGLGSNLGDKVKNIEDAIKGISVFATLIRKSSLIETAALLPDNSPASWDIDFVNQVISVHSSLTPQELLAEINRTEAALGRRRTTKWAPRVIDIDILWFYGKTMSHANLTVPHPEILNRPFVINPIREIAPEIADSLQRHAIT